ncbi:MAG: hypothetical protein KKF58_01915 [Gammaproteobacteria bacterium]|nr:hypothetical protein [Gammaproteobacteria bacterium]MBU1447044.1 hypothetical protein [Gammaproteobacteria bacterium]
MTLIAAQVINGIPIILGDLLLTREQGGDDPNVNCIPTIKRANEHLSPHGEMRVVGLSQKVNIVSRNVCIAWSGAKYQASALIRHLREHWGEGEVSEEEFNECLDGYPKEEINDIHVIAYLYDKGKKSFCFRDNIGGVPFELDGLQNVQLAGSGSGAYLEVVEQYFTGSKAIGEATSLDKVLSKVMGFTSSVLGVQMMSGMGLLEGWGGGFEIAYIHGGRFEKLSEVLCLFWKAQQNESGDTSFSLFQRIVKTTYQNERLVLYVIDWMGEVSEESIFVVDPLFDIDKRAPIVIPDFNYKWIVNVFQVAAPDGSNSYMTRVDRPGSGKAPIRIEIMEDSFKMHFSDEYLKSLFGSDQAASVGGE